MISFRFSTDNFGWLFNKSFKTESKKWLGLYDIILDRSYVPVTIYITDLRFLKIDLLNLWMKIAETRPTLTIDQKWHKNHLK
jgi:hypothetical protein